MPRWLQPIATLQPRLPWLSVGVVNLLWVCQIFSVFVQGNAVVLTTRRFTQDPRVFALIASLWPLLGLTVGSLCNYLADRIWTPFGRRRPFIIVGWTAAGIGIGLVPHMPDLPALLVVLVAYSVVVSLAGPLEPFCIEFFPPAQRGRALAMRQAMVSIAALVYFQGLFPLFDLHFAWPAAIPAIGGHRFSGEQLIYALTSAFFLAMVALTALVLRETQPAPTPVVPRATRSLHRVVVTFFSEVFGDRRWWWIYGVYMLGGLSLGNVCWAHMDVLLTTEQLGYSKLTVALLGLPCAILSIVAIAPFFGWYSDRLPRFPPWLLLGLIGTAFTALVWSATRGGGASPPLAAVFATGLFATVLGGACYLLVIQTLVSRETAVGALRVRVAWVTLMVQIASAGVLWLVIKFGAGGAPPNPLVWLACSQAFGSFIGANAVVVAPMVFDFVPCDKMGTLSAGFGVIGYVSSAVFANLGGYWIYLFSRGGAEGRPDYASNYLFQMIVGLIALAVLTRIVQTVRRGAIVEYGRLGLASDGTANRAEAALKPQPTLVR